MNTNNSSYYLLANFGRSFDKRHINEFIPHLIMSGYYTNKDVKMLELQQKINNCMIIRITNSMDSDCYTNESESSEGQTKYIEHVISLGYLLSLKGLKVFDYLIQSLFGFRVSDKKEKDLDGVRFSGGIIYRDKFVLNYGFNNILFVFENLQWFNVKHLFDLINVKVSGGSITRRHLISTTNFNLISFLIRLGYKHKDIYDSISLDKSSKLLLSDLNNVEIDKNSVAISDYTTTKILEELDDSIKELELLKIFLDKEVFNLNTKVLDINLEIKNSNGKKDLVILSELENLNKKIQDCHSNRNLLDSNLNYICGWWDRIHEFGFEIDSLENLFIGFLKRRNYLNRINSSNKYVFIEKLIKANGNWDSDLKTKNKKKGKMTDDKLGIRKYSSYSKVNSINKNKLNVHLDKVLSSLSKSRIIPIKLGNRQYKSFSSLGVKRDYSSVKAINKLNFNIDSPIFIELQRICKTSSLDENTQLKIEQFLNDQGSLLLKRRIDQNLDINYYKLNPSVIDYLKKYISELESLLNNYRSSINLVSNKDINKKVEYLLITGLSNDVIISQLFGRLIRIISNNYLLNNNTNCTSLSIDLAKSLLFIFYSQEHKKNSNINYSLSTFIDQNYYDLNKNISDSVLAFIGLKLLNFLEEVGLIKSEIYVSSKDQKNLIYVCNSTILEYIDKNNHLFSISYKVPMIVKPKLYSKDLNTGKETLGGYLLNDVDYISPLIIKNSELKEQSQIENKNIIFDVINNLSSVGYKINIPVLNFILENGLNYNLFTDPDFVHPLEIKKKQNKILTLSEKKKLDAFLSRKQLDMNILGLALIYKNIPEFFIPVRIDNRGRIYCMADYLNYQGIELAKSLLLFSKDEKINKSDKLSIDYLKIFGANCYGNGIDKKSYNDRVEWVNINEYDILNFSNGKLLKDADSKLLFIAFCFEYINYHQSLNNNETYFRTNFPIQLDATCNGYQHLSLLTGDEPLAGQLNLISGDNDTKPNDFYGYVGLKINDYLLKKKSEATNNREESIKIIESCDRLLGMKMNRSLVKLAVMVKPYNAGLLTMIDYIKENFEKLNSTENNEVYYMLKANNNIKLNNFDFLFFVRTLEEVIYNEFPKLKEFNLYLKEVAQICCLLNITITWVLPSGLNVKQFYLDSEAIRLKPFKFRKNTYTLKIKTNRINKNKQIRALMPNLIHSLDAASLCLIVDMFNQTKNNSNRINFFCIHDCFAVTANNIVNLIKIIKLVYIKIYSEDSYLKRFDQGIIDSIKLQFGNESFNDKTKKITVNELGIDYPDVDNVIFGRIKASKINKANSIIN